MKKNNVFKEIAKGLVVTVVGFVLLEALLRIAYFGRNWMVTEIPVTYMFGDDHRPNSSLAGWSPNPGARQGLDLEESTKHPAEVHRFFQPRS